MNKAIFIDKDGTLIKNIPYNVDPTLVTLESTAADGLHLLQQLGYLLIVVSNQAGVAKGYFEEKDLAKVNKAIATLLETRGVTIDAFYYCPHHPDGIVAPYAIVCNCRKPEPGMLLKAAADFGIDLPGSWMIGDILNDVEAGKRAGCQAILLNNGGETEWSRTGPYRQPDYEAPDLYRAARFIATANSMVHAF